MGADAAAVAGGEEAGQRRPAVGADDRLGDLDHDLAAQRALGQPVAALENLEQPHQRPRLLGHGHLRQRDHEVGRQRAAGFADQGVEEDLQRPRAAGLPFLTHRLDTDAEERRQPLFTHAAGDLAGGGDRGGILLGVGAGAEAVLEVEAEVLDRLAFQLAADALVDRRRQPALGIRRREAHAARELGRAVAVGVHGGAGDLAEPRRRLGLEQLRPAVDGVDRLPRRAVARVGLHERTVGGAERVEVGLRVVEQRHGLYVPRYVE